MRTYMHKRNGYLHKRIESYCFEEKTEMGEMKTHRAAPYSTTDEPETLAIDILRNLVDHKRVKLDIKERDKYPNIDGYVELVDESRIPIAKLEVQIRKLPNDERKIQCPVTLLSYSEIACLPVLLIGVDVKRKIARWVHLKKDLIAESTIGINQKTKLISFPVNNFVDGKALNYITEWENISQMYQMKIRGYDELKCLYELLSKRSKPALGVDRKDFRDIHLFLDEINTLLDGKFSIVKKIFYPTTWKVGLAYYRYEDDSVSYSLYPIPASRNDVQIKEGDDLLRKELWNEGLAITGHNIENPIKLRPREYGIEIVESKTLRLLKSRLLNHTGNEFLVREFIFAFIDKYSRQLGFEKKDRYSVDEIEKALYQLLPVGFDTHVQATVEIVMGRYRFHFGVFQKSISFLKSNAFEEISRVYVQKDFSRLKRGGLIYNLFSPQAVETNLKIFFDNLPKVYDDMVFQNFPKIAEELPLFGDASRVIIFFSAKEEYKTFRDGPKIEFFYLKTQKQDNLEIEIHRKEETKEIPDLSWEYLGKVIEINGRKHRLLSASRGILDFIYDDIPMFNFVYKTLEENLKRYFNSLRAFITSKQT